LKRLAVRPGQITIRMTPESQSSKPFATPSQIWVSEPACRCEDLLAENDTDSTAALPSASQILTTAPVSENDYRKLFIDISGVRNAFIRRDEDHVVYTHCLQKEEAEESFSQGKLSYRKNLGDDYRNIKEFTLQGLNRILFEPELSIQMMDVEEKAEKVAMIRESIKKAYHANRNLCEDLTDVKKADTQDILVCGDMEIESDANGTEVMSEFLFRVQKHLSPYVKRYSLQQLLGQGKSTEEIFEGPVLQNGFILNDELKNANFRTSLHLSDIIRIAKETPGIKTIRSLQVHKCDSKSSEDDCTGSGQTENKWTICFPPDHEKVLRVKLNPSVRRTNLFKNVVPVGVKPGDVHEKLLQKQLDHEKDNGAELRRYAG
jgi:uncharacterized protein